MKATDLKHAEELAEALRAAVDGDVRFDAGGRALYATDASNYRQIPIGVVVPRHADDVIAAMALCRQAGAPVLGRGGGTSLAGQCCNVGVVFDFSKYMNRVISIDVDGKTARIEPGIVLDDLRAATTKHGLTFGPDPATHNHCTLGGMIGNNSCGVHALMAGRTEDNVHALEVLTYRGDRFSLGGGVGHRAKVLSAGGAQDALYRKLESIRDRYADQVRRRFPDIPRRVSGYGLTELLPEKGFNVARAFVGTESTCGLVLEATVRLVKNPPFRTLVLVGYEDRGESADDVPHILEFGPIGLEGIDEDLVSFEKLKNMNVEALRKLPDGAAWLFVEFGGDTREEADARAHAMMQSLSLRRRPPVCKLFDDEKDMAALWKVRESGLGATAFVPGMPDGAPGWEDAAVDPRNLGAYLREFKALLDRYDYRASLYGHYGQGCVHCRISFDLKTAAGIRHYRAFVDDAADLVLRYGGSLSGEHGDGQSRGELLPKMFGPEVMQAFREFKAAWDPDNKMNPGKKINALPIVADLRLGTSYAPPVVKTHFAFTEDEGSFARAAMRCIGIGECRKTEHGTMCPSYMATRDEMHSTRGRGHLLFEMLEGNPIRDGWRDDHVREALDLCLACKACKKECPVNVDMATYKAEFLSHHYAGRLRPRAAYAFGFIHRWARLASLAPGLVNAIAGNRITGPLVKWAANIHPSRELPRFAPETFRAWFQRRPAASGERQRRVLLWTDTFNNHFHPQVAAAAVRVLETAGFRVEIPTANLCCGRPLYDFGFLGSARKLLDQTLDHLRDDIRAGTPIIGLEPSCVSVFRDELTGLKPGDMDARRLSEQTFLLGEFLQRERPEAHFGRLHGQALLQTHCHQRAVAGPSDDARLLERIGLSCETLDAGCCGMAGAFGFEKGKRDVSLAIAERKLIPAVAAAPEALVIADGFSCREQVRQTTGRSPIHLAEAICRAMDAHPGVTTRNAGAVSASRSAPVEG